MATASSQRPLPLLRRPLPPKQSPPPSSIRSKPEEVYLDPEDYKVLSKSPVFSTKSTRTKSKVVSPVRGVRFYGDVPLPRTSVVKPYKSKGPDPLPPRPPKKPRELPSEAFIQDSYVRPPPDFTLKDFVRRLPSREGVDDNGDPMVSEENYEKITSWFAANKPNQAAIHSFDIDSGVNVPDVTPRVPARQLLIEMQFQGVDTSLWGERDLMYSPDRPSTMLPVTPAVSKLTIPASKYVPLPPIDNTPTAEGESALPLSSERLDRHFPTRTILVGQTTDERTLQQEGVDREVKGREKEVKTRFEDRSFGNEEHSDDRWKSPTKDKTLTFELEPAMEYNDVEVILPSSRPEYFQREELPRSSSPFVGAHDYDEQMSPIEAVILNAMMTGSSLLNLRAHFLNRLPDLSSLTGMLTHLNLSFNDFWVFPPEILSLVNLVSLKLRDNPIKELPHDINQLKRLRVLEMSFNLLTSLPTSLFELEHLELLDLAYNRLSFIPSEIGNLSGSLRELNLEGNQLGAMPDGALHLKLRYLKINNNFTHPLLWRETASNQPQRLGDLSALAVANAGIDYKSVNLPQTIRNILESPSRCGCCGGPMYGQGLRVIRAPAEIFRFKQLPFLFQACTQSCRKQFAKNPLSIQQWFQRNTIPPANGTL